MRRLTVSLRGGPFKTARYPSAKGAAVLSADTMVTLPDKHVALLFKKGVVPRGVCDRMYPVLRKIARRSRARATAAGPLRASTRAKVRKHPHLKQINSYAYVQNRPGLGPGGQQYTSSVQSGAAGWITDKDVTRYTYDNFDGGYQTALELADIIDAAFARALPARHAAQAADLAKRPRMAAGFSTMAANYNFRTALHRDNKTQPGSMLVFTLLGDDRAKGGLLTFPQLGVAVDLRKGDMLAFDADLLHGNTAFYNKTFNRLSLVFYNKIPR